MENIIKQKDLELNSLTAQINNIQMNSNNNLIYNNHINNINVPNNNFNININDMVCINFISSEQKIHFAVPCIKSNIFAEIEEKLYK